MKGVVLAGGLGTRLHPITKVTNKHLLPIYNKPMIYYPIETLVRAGIEEILIVTGGNNAGDFLRLLGNGKEFGLKHLHYTYQEGEGGIAEALGLAEHFADEEPILVILGDNIIEMNIIESVQSFMKQGKGGKVVNIIEKPKKPKTHYAVTGLYMYDSYVFEIIHDLKPSDRGELEITDVNNAYIQKGEMTFSILEGWWTDAGTFESLFRANFLISEKHKKRDGNSIQTS